MLLVSEVRVDGSLHFTKQSSLISPDSVIYDEVTVKSLPSLAKVLEAEMFVLRYRKLGVITRTLKLVHGNCSFTIMVSPSKISISSPTNNPLICKNLKEFAAVCSTFELMLSGGS